MWDDVFKMTQMSLLHTIKIYISEQRTFNHILGIILVIVSFANFFKNYHFIINLQTVRYTQLYTTFSIWIKSITNNLFMHVFALELYKDCESRWDLFYLYFVYIYKYADARIMCNVFKDHISQNCYLYKWLIILLHFQI